MSRESTMPGWIPFVLGVVGFEVGWLLLPMRWWRHDETGLVLPTLLLTACLVAMFAAHRVGGLFRPLSVILWLGLGAHLAQFVCCLWIVGMNRDALANAAAVWAGTVTVEAALLGWPSRRISRARTA